MSYREVQGKPGMLPGFGPRLGWPSDSQRVLLIDAQKLKEVCRKIVRGLEYWQAGRYIEPPYRHDVYVIPEEAESQLPTLVGISQHLGPGFVVKRGLAEEDAGHVLYRIRIWDKLTVHGAVFAHDFEAPSDHHQT
jgi:hypothetical protein